MIVSNARFTNPAAMGVALLIAMMGAVSIGVRAQWAPAAAPPRLGDKARDFTLRSLDGTTVRLSEELARGPLVLAVLRGWPGYQCPFCTRQFSDYLAHAGDFEKAGARVLFIYPGPGDGLEEHAKAFTAVRAVPAGFRILLDPDYTFTQAYALRWNAPNETAYPSTFVVDRNGIVAFARVSRVHGDRVPAAAVLEALAELRR